MTASEPLTPQQRWQHFRAEKLPQLSRRQQWLYLGLTIVALLLFIFLIFPFLLPFAGPNPVASHTLADSNGKFIDIQEVDLYYVHLPADGETVLLLHGLGGSTLTWHETMPILNEAGYNVYAIDLPGAGLSEKGLHLNYSHPFQVDLIAHFLDSQNSQQVNIVAHALSANLALMLAQTYPERVNKIVLVAPTILTEPTPQAPALLFDLPFLERWFRVLFHWVIPEAVGEQLRSATKRDEVVTEELIADYSRVLKTKDWDLTAIGLLRDSHLNTLPAPLSEIHQPILLLWGTGDGWSPPDHAIGLLEKLPNASLIEFQDVGHLPMHEVPHDFNTSLINFLDNKP